MNLRVHRITAKPPFREIETWHRALGKPIVDSSACFGAVHHVLLHPSHPAIDDPSFQGFQHSFCSHESRWKPRHRQFGAWNEALRRKTSIGMKPTPREPSNVKKAKKAAALQKAAAEIGQPAFGELPSSKQVMIKIVDDLDISERPTRACPSRKSPRRPAR